MPGEVYKNHGFTTGGAVIFLGAFDDPDLERIAFFHELAHTRIFDRMQAAGNTAHLCELAKEGEAWSLTFTLLAEHGFYYSYESKERVWARQQFFSYLRSDATVLDIAATKEPSK